MISLSPRNQIFTLLCGKLEGKGKTRHANVYIARICLQLVGPAQNSHCQPPKPRLFISPATLQTLHDFSPRRFDSSSNVVSTVAHVRLLETGKILLDILEKHARTGKGSRQRRQCPPITVNFIGSDLDKTMRKRAGVRALVLQRREGLDLLQHLQVLGEDVRPGCSVYLHICLLKQTLWPHCNRLIPMKWVYVIYMCKNMQ